MDTLQQEKARMTLRQGIKMQGQDLNKYITKFEDLVSHTQYDINGPQTIDMFTRGLPMTLYKTVYQQNNLRMATLKRQGLWFHMNVRRNLEISSNHPLLKRQVVNDPSLLPSDTQMQWM